MTIRMTAPRLARLIVEGDLEAVRAAVAEAPDLLTTTVERDGQGGWTPLHVAVAECRTDVVRVLVDAGADLTARTENFRTPLHVALQFCPALVPLLRELGAVVDAASAAYLGDVEQLQRELDAGAELSAPHTGDLLTGAAYGGASVTARLLLDRGADADAGALHAAAGRGHPELVRLLLDSGADVDRRDPASGRTALHTAVQGGAPEVARILLTAGADVDATTFDGASALDMSRVAAARSRHDTPGEGTDDDVLVELLVAHGATD
jgi:ankyrin repeat protein